MSCSAMGGSGVVTGAMKLTSLSWISYRIFRPCDGYSPHPYVAQYLIHSRPYITHSRQPHREARQPEKTERKSRSRERDGSLRD